MQFVYHPQSGADPLVVEGEIYNYMFKVRRHRKGEEIALRNLQDEWIYFYRIEEVHRREAVLRLIGKERKVVAPSRYFHLIWCVIDPKTIEKTLPSLNELGVSKITFVYCQRSQRNFRLRMEKLRKILINSSQQCGRSELMELEMVEDLQEVLRRYPDTVLVDFCQSKIENSDSVQRAVIGPEGGISYEERELFDRVVGLDTPLILRSETAAMAVSAKVLV